MALEDEEDEEDVVPTEEDVGKTLEEEQRAKGERFILDHYPELAEFPELQQ